jgi:threonine synthase
MEALGRDTSHKEESFLLKELSSLTGQPLPAKLAELKSLPEIHRDVCEKDEMADVLYRFLNIP